MYQDAIQSVLGIQVNRRMRLAKKGSDYKAHKTESKVKDVKIIGDKATQIVTESVVLNLDPTLGGPKVTKYLQDHVFEYVNVAGQWKMTSDKLINVPTEPEEIKAPLPSGTTPTIDGPARATPLSRQHPVKSAGTSFSPDVFFIKAGFSPLLRRYL